eukprot:15450359-Alexandrium_andersonii.AAC.1
MASGPATARLQHRQFRKRNSVLACSAPNMPRRCVKCVVVHYIAGAPGGACWGRYPRRRYPRRQRKRWLGGVWSGAKPLE